MKVLGGDTPSGTAPTGSTSNPSTPQPKVPAGARAALSALARAEQEASKARAADTANAVSGEFARILASIAASNAQHAVVLGKAAQVRAEAHGGR